MYIITNIIALSFALFVVLISLSMIVGFNNIKELGKSILKAGLWGNLKKTYTPYKIALDRMSKIEKYFLYAFVIILILYVFILSFNTGLIQTHALNFTTIIVTIITAVITILVLYFLLALLLLIVFNTVEYLFNFAEKYEENKISNIMLISLIFSTVLLFLLIQNKMLSNIKIQPISTLFLLVIAVSLHIDALYGAILVIKYVNPLKGKQNNTELLIGMLVWLFAMLIPIYTEVLLCAQYTNSAFIFSNSREAVIGLWDFLYFTLVTFATVGFGDILPNHPLSKGITMGIILSSIIYLVLFIGSTISGLTVKNGSDNN